MMIEHRIKLSCKECNTVLIGRVYPEDKSHVLVNPCPKCWKKDYDAGHSEGFSAGLNMFKEHSNVTITKT